LEAASDAAAGHFRAGRATEPLELYVDLFDEAQGRVEAFLAATDDLLGLASKAPVLLGSRAEREVFRYLSGPPVSEDDLKVLIEARSLAPARVQQEPELVRRLLAFLRDWHDRRRFPWLAAQRRPTASERQAAVLATATLLASRRLETMRRSQGKELQEERVAAALRRTGLVEAATRRVRTLGEAPRRGEFCRESYLGERKADFLVGLWDGRVMPLECKVSNSATNSVKRLNNDAAVKAEVWRQDFGAQQVVPAAVLSGVYKLHNLENAQERGLTLFWAHDLQPMLDWLHRTRDSA
jgi:hypothetical protein